MKPSGPLIPARDRRVFLRAPSAIALITLFATFLCGQEPSSRRVGGPDDWTHHHLIFSNAGTEDEAVRSGAFDRWLSAVNDPRYALQHKKREAASTGTLNLDRVIPSAETEEREPIETCGRVRRTEMERLPRGLRPARKSFLRFERECRPFEPRSRFRHARQLLHPDWSEDMGAGATVGLGMFPAKYSFDISSANCASAPQPDFVVYNTGLTGSSSQASVIAYDNLYSGCSGNSPATYWAYDTGGAVVTSAVLSLDGKQVAFAQTNSTGSATLVLLKWAASNTETASKPGTPTAETASTYRACAAPCSLTLDFSGGADDSESSVFYDYGSDTIYVGDDAGQLHKFTGAFSGTPAEATGAWPVTLSTAALGAPIFDAASGNIFVGDYLVDLASNCGPEGTPCGFLYSVKASSGAHLGTSSQLDYGFGIVDAPLVDSTAGKVYVFAGADTSFTGPSACGVDVACSGVFQFATNFTSGSGIEAQTGPGFEFMMSGSFDNAYFSSANGANPTGHLYVVGNTGAANNTLFQIRINAGVMSTSPISGPQVSSNFTNGLYSAGMQVTEIDTGANDFLFLSVLSFGTPVNCNSNISNGCIIGFDVTGGTISGITVPTGAVAEAGGTSGIIVDNISAFAGASNIYYTPLADQTCTTSGGTGGCAIQISQILP